MERDRIGKKIRVVLHFCECFEEFIHWFVAGMGDGKPSAKKPVETHRGERNDTQDIDGLIEVLGDTTEIDDAADENAQHGDFVFKGFVPVNSRPPTWEPGSLRAYLSHTPLAFDSGARRSRERSGAQKPRNLCL